MARERIIYEEDLRRGEVVRIKGRTHRVSRELEDFNTRMRNTLYDMECREGARFRIPGMSTNLMKEVWGKRR